MPKSLIPNVLQLVPSMESGGVERGTVDVSGYLMHQGCTSVVISKGGGLVPSIEEDGAIHIVMDLTTHNPFVIYKNLQKIKQVIKKYNINIIHARSRIPGIYGVLLARCLKIPYLTTIHSAYPYKTWLKKHYNAIMTKSDHMIVPSLFIKEHVTAHYGVASSKMTVIPRGVDLAFFNPDAIGSDRIEALRGKWHIPEAQKVMVVPGRIARSKGLEIVLAALKQIKNHEAFQGWGVYIVGGTNKKKSKFICKIEQLISEHGLANQAKMVGLERDMPAVYALADLSVTASTQAEAFGRVNAEAGSMGVPVVTTNHGGSREIIVDNTTGWLVTPNDSDALAEQLETVCALSTAERLAVGVAAMAHVRSMYPNQKMLENTYALYQKMLQEGSS